MNSLTADMIAGFTQQFVLANLDNPLAVPDFHRDLWMEACSSKRLVSLICPRGHGKSTAITEIATLAHIMFKIKDYGIIISDTLDQAVLFLGGIKALIEGSDEMQEFFGFKRWLKDGQTEVIGLFEDGRQFNLTALGRGQRIRGRLWRNKRPNWIVCDDIEDEKSVESDDQREATIRWLYRAVIPAMSDTGCIRVTGTILHLDAMLYRLHHNPAWKSILYKAHKSFNDFDEILWPEKFPEWRLREIQKAYVEEGNPDQYSTEYLNDPIDQSEAYFSEDDFIPMEPEDSNLPMEYYGAVDFAISDDDRAAYTAIVIGGLAADGLLRIVKVLRYRSNDALLHVNNLIALQQAYNVQLWAIEKGQIQGTMEGILYDQMLQTGVTLNMDPDTVPRGEKRGRARSFQGLMRANKVRWDTRAAWYPDCKIELLQFPKGRYKDQVDALAWLGRLIAQFAPALTKEEYEYMRKMRHQEEMDRQSIHFGADPDTGY